MRFLHTSDWHVGKSLRNIRRDDECAAALAEVLAIAKDRAVDAVLVAGDVFDTAVPTPDAERMLARGRAAYWHNESGTIVLLSPSDPDGGTCFKPGEGRRYFESIG